MSNAEPSTHSVLSLKMKIRPYQAHIIEKRFEVARKLYNSLLGLELKKYRALTRTPEYREIQGEIDRIPYEYSEETQEELSNNDERVARVANSIRAMKPMRSGGKKKTPNVHNWRGNVHKSDKTLENQKNASIIGNIGACLQSKKGERT